jgi:uncharacterized membrane protein
MPILVLGYPPACHFGALTGRPWVGLVWLGLLFAVGAWGKDGARLPLVALTAAALAGAASVDAGLGAAVLRLAPILVTGSLALVFGDTLRPGRIPLVNAIALRSRGTLPPSAAIYGRRLTVFWTGLFLLLTLESLLLALFASDRWWSLMTNVVNYVLLGTVFVVEYGVRRLILTGIPHEGLVVYLRDLIRVGLPRQAAP